MQKSAWVLLIAVFFGTATLQAQTPTSTTQVDASRGGVTISSGVNSLTIGARFQFRWTADDRESFDADIGGSGVGVADGVRSQFDVPRMRVTLSGGAFRPWVRYLFQFDFSRTAGEGDSKIKDAYIEIRPTGRTFLITMGQFKAPFGLQQLTSSGRLQFVDRAITDAKFHPAREMGVMFSGTAAEQKLGYALDVFNGSGESVRQLNRSQIWAARVYVDPLGVYALSEGSSDAGARPVLHFGFAVRGGEPIRGRSPLNVFRGGDNQTAYDAEFAFKSRRFYSTAEYYWMTDEQQNPVAGRDIDSTGYHAQVSVMPIPPKVELGVRFAEIDSDKLIDDARLREVRGVVSYYWQSHNLKLQADFGQLHYGQNFSTLSSIARAGLPGLGDRLVSGQSISDTELRVQFQLTF